MDAHELFDFFWLCFECCGGCYTFSNCGIFSFHKVLTWSCILFLLFCFRLATYGLAELQMEGDGNCQVCCISRYFVFNIVFYFYWDFEWLSFLIGMSCKIMFLILKQFRALADQLFRNPDYHKHVRRQVIKQVGVILNDGL